MSEVSRCAYGLVDIVVWRVDRFVLVTLEATRFFSACCPTLQGTSTTFRRLPSTTTAPTGASLLRGNKQGLLDGMRMPLFLQRFLHFQSKR